MEKENKVLVTELNNLRHQVERIKGEKDEMGEELAHIQALLASEQNKVQVLKESKEREEEEWRSKNIAKHNLVKEKTEEVKGLNICSRI